MNSSLPFLKWEKRSALRAALAIVGAFSFVVGTLAIAGSSSTYQTVRSPEGQMLIRESLVFRHSTDPAFNSDWGIVSFSDGRVVRVDFSPD